MRRREALFLLVGLALVGCQGDKSRDKAEDPELTYVTIKVDGMV